MYKYTRTVSNVASFVSHRGKGISSMAFSKGCTSSLETLATFFCRQPGMKLISLHPKSDCDLSNETKAILSTSPGGWGYVSCLQYRHTHRKKLHLVSFCHPESDPLLAAITDKTKSDSAFRVQFDTSIPWRYRTHVFGNEPRKIICFLLNAYLGKDVKFMLKTKLCKRKKSTKPNPRHFLQTALNQQDTLRTCRQGPALWRYLEGVQSCKSHLVY